MNVPKNLEECYAALDGMLVAEDKEVAMNNPKFPVMVHHSLGRDIRNDWNLWRPSDLTAWFNDLGITGADDMSGIILTSYCRYLRSEPIELEEQVKEYLEYWQEDLDTNVFKPLKILYTNEQVDEAIGRMAEEISESGNVDNMVFIIILKGGVFTGMKLLESIGADIPYGFIGLNSYIGESTKSSDKMNVTYKPIFDYDFLLGKDVWIIDDVVETGKTLFHADKLLTQYGPRSIRAAVLVSKGEKHGKEFIPSVVGLEANEDDFIVGCGMGLGEKYRSLTSIYIYKERG
jgi:hypoxanthine phosphoribosyltransferase